jgi:hypothetical protein
MPDGATAGGSTMSGGEAGSAGPDDFGLSATVGCDRGERPTGASTAAVTSPAQTSAAASQIRGFFAMMHVDQ